MVEPPVSHGRHRRILVALGVAAALTSLTVSLPMGFAADDGESLHHARVEQWRPLVDEYWGAQGYADEVEYALMILSAESTGVPSAVNPRSNASGLFQHLPKYWEERSRAAGWAGADIFDPEANIAVAAWLRATSPERGWKHWEPTHDRYPVGSWGEDTHWDAGAGRYVNVGGGHLSLGGVFVEAGPFLALEITRVADGNGEPPLVTVGGRVEWSYDVTNTGEADLWALYLWDDALGEVRCPDDDLEPGETVRCEATETARRGEHRDRVLAFAWDDGGREASASAEGSYVGIAGAGEASHGLTMTVASARWEGEAGRPIVRSYLLRNTGPEPLWAAFVWDDQLGEIACPIDDLSPGRSIVCWMAFSEDAETSVTAWAWTDDGLQIEVAAEGPALGG